MAEDERILDRLFICCFDKFFYSFLIQGFRFHSVVREPFLHLLHAVRVVEVRDILHGGSQFLLRAFIESDCVFNHGHIQGDPSVIDFLIEMVFIPDKIRNRVFDQTLLDRHFHFHIPAVVFLEADPFFAVVLR